MVECDYKIFGLSPDAAFDEVRAAWRRVVFNHHPDRIPDKDLGCRYIIRANSAYKRIVARLELKNQAPRPKSRQGLGSGIRGRLDLEEFEIRGGSPQYVHPEAPLKPRPEPVRASSSQFTVAKESLHEKMALAASEQDPDLIVPEELQKHMSKFIDLRLKSELFGRNLALNGFYDDPSGIVDIERHLPVQRHIPHRLCFVSGAVEVHVPTRPRYGRNVFAFPEILHSGAFWKMASGVILVDMENVVDTPVFALSRKDNAIRKSTGLDVHFIFNSAA